MVSREPKGWCWKRVIEAPRSIRASGKYEAGKKGQHDHQDSAFLSPHPGVFSLVISSQRGSD